jgi:hypothetical protein
MALEFLVDYTHLRVDNMTYTLRSFGKGIGALEPGAEVNTKDGRGNTCKGKIVGFEHDIVQIALDADTFKGVEQEGYNGN